MSKDSLVRIEFKLDCIMNALKKSGVMILDLPELRGIDRDICPVCTQQIRIVIDFETETPVYTCGCRLPAVIVPGISKIVPSRNTNEHAKRNQEDAVSPDSPPSGDRDR